CAGDPCRRGGRDAWQGRIVQSQAANVAPPIGSPGVADPGSNVVPGYIQRFTGREAEPFGKLAQVARHGRQVIAMFRLVRVTQATRVDRNHAAVRRRQGRHDAAPSIPALRPTGQEQQRLSTTAFDVMQREFTELDMMMAKAVLGREYFAWHT